MGCVCSLFDVGFLVVCFGYLFGGLGVVCMAVCVWLVVCGGFAFACFGYLNCCLNYGCLAVCVVC